MIQGLRRKRQLRWTWKAWQILQDEKSKVKKRENWRKWEMEGSSGSTEQIKQFGPIHVKPGMRLRTEETT